MQAVNSNNDRSQVVKKRIPGWGEEVDTIAVTSVEFSEDAKTVTVRADTTNPGAAVSGIYVDEIFYEGNPVTCPVPEGARYLDFQAKDSFGDYSPIINRRVPGWSEVVDSIVVTSIELNQERTQAVISAEDSLGKAILGIHVNEEFYPSNPVTYSVPQNTTAITAQAVNEDGDQSKPVTKELPPLYTGGSGGGHSAGHGSTTFITVSAPKE